MGEVIRRRGAACCAPTVPLYTLLLLFALPTPALASDTELVILVHGMGRTKLSMLPMKWALEREGYRVYNWGYSSFGPDCVELSRKLEQVAKRFDNDSSVTRIHFVTHSLGGILVRDMLSRGAIAKAGRVVMLAPPNRGSAMADRMPSFLSYILRPMKELTTDSTSFANSIQPLPREIEVGIIAGTYDAKVRPEETFLPEAVDSVSVPAAHTFIMNRGDVRRMTCEFIKNGQFE